MIDYFALITSKPIALIFYTSLVIALIFNPKITMTIFISIVILTLSPLLININTLIKSLGSDSVSEGLNFNFQEAIFYVGTLSDTLKVDYNTYAFTLFMIISFSTIFYCLPLTFKNITKKTYLFSIIILTVAFVYKSHSIFNEDLFEYNKILKNFTQINQFKNKTLKTSTDIDVIIYIGESTSKSHMSIYGYFRKTTPNLDKLKKLNDIIIFDEIFSTHSHTSPSLLEALSIANTNYTEKLDTIYNRKRISVTELLEIAKVNTFLYSNQNPTGTYNYASSIIFKNTKHQLYNKKGLSSGNRGSKKSARKFDSEFIKKNIDSIMKNNGVTFFHSYAGHGDYCYNIPERNHSKIDDTLSSIDINEITGGISSIQKIECYDMAIKYIDENINTFIEAIKKESTPKAFIYFSDHGESVYTGTGHDSSRLQIDMVSVPLLVYLNDSAKKIVKLDLNKKLMRKLDYIPYLIFKILGVNIGEYHNDNIIMVRNTIAGKEHINLASTKNKNWIFNQHANTKTPKQKHSCLHRTNNLGKLNQGRLAFSCLEFDVVVNKNGEVYVDHDYPAVSKLEAELLIQNTKHNNLSIWIDAKNIDTEINCLILSRKISKGERDVLIEFPTSSIDNLELLNSCIESLHKKVDYISYYVPTEELVSCQGGNRMHCSSLMTKLNYIKKSGKFNSYSFDYRGIDFMLSQKEVFEGMFYHSWGITDIADERLSNITMGILSSEKMLNQN